MGLECDLFFCQGLSKMPQLDAPEVKAEEVGAEKTGKEGASSLTEEAVGKVPVELDPLTRVRDHSKPDGPSDAEGEPPRKKQTHHYSIVLRRWRKMGSDTAGLTERHEDGERRERADRGRWEFEEMEERRRQRYRWR